MLEKANLGMLIETINSALCDYFVTEDARKLSGEKNLTNDSSCRKKKFRQVLGGKLGILLILLKSLKDKAWYL